MEGQEEAVDTEETLPPTVTQIQKKRRKSTKENSKKKSKRNENEEVPIDESQTEESEILEKKEKKKRTRSKVDPKLPRTEDGELDKSKITMKDFIRLAGNTGKPMKAAAERMVNSLIAHYLHP
jgi:hypothetical protein